VNGKHHARARWECHPCKKTAFGSESRAQETIERVKDKPGRKPIRAYPCKYGNGWHLTAEDEWSLV
jgi:hypothetical protein